MVNTIVRSPGNLATFEGNPEVGGGVPDYAVDQSAPFDELAAVGEGLAGKFRGLADQAAQAAGVLQGTGYVQSLPGANYNTRQAVVAAASGHASGGADSDLFAGVNMSTLPAGMRNNNPGNIKFSPSINWAGQVGPSQNTDQGDPQVVFDSSADGMRAVAKLVLNKFGKQGFNTVRKLIASPGGWTPGYLPGAQGVAQAAGLGLDQPLDMTNPQVLAQVMRGIVTQEHGPASKLYSDALIQSAAEAALGKAPPSIPTPGGPAAEATPQLPATPLALRNDGTIAGNAFDAAAIGAYSWRTQASLTSDLSNAFIQNQNDPVAYEQAVAQIRANYGKDQNLQDPRLAEAVDKTFTQQTLGDRLKLADIQAQKLKLDQNQAIEDGITATEGTLQRQAYNLGGNPAADSVLAPQLASANTAIDNAVLRGALTPQGAQAHKQRLAMTVAMARSQGVFDALPTPASKQQFANGLLADWSEGKGPLAALPLENVRSISSTLYGQATQQATAQNAALKAQRGQLKQSIEDDVAATAATGNGLDPTKSNLDPGTVGALLGPAALTAWQARRAQAQQVFAASAGMETESADEIRDHLATMEPQPDQPGYQQLNTVYNAAKAHANQLIALRNADPLGAAQQAGIVALRPIDATNAQTLEATLDQRRKDAATVASAYGTPPTWFRPAERASLVSGLMQQPALIPQFALTVKNLFGVDAGRALGELGDNQTGAMLAQAAGITAQTGDSSVAQELAQSIAARNAGDKSLKLPKDGSMPAIGSQLLGGALASRPGQQGTVLALAQALYEDQARAQGFTPEDLKQAGSPAQSAYSQAVRRALGQRMVNGVQFGGLTTINGTPTVAQSTRPASDVGDLLGQTSDDDLNRLPPIASANGFPVSAAQLRGAHLVAVGDGQYRAALNDPQSLDPQYLRAPGGGFWSFGLDQLDAAQQARTAAAAAIAPRAPFAPQLGHVR